MWKAFALGAAAAALVVVALDLAHPDRMSPYATLANVLAVIGAGAASALLAVAPSRYARLGLDRVEQLLVALHVEHRAGAPDELPSRPIEEGGV